MPTKPALHSRTVCNPTENKFHKKNTFCYISWSLNIVTVLIKNQLEGYTCRIIRIMKLSEYVTENLAFTPGSLSLPPLCKELPKVLW